VHYKDSLAKRTSLDLANFDIDIDTPGPGALVMMRYINVRFTHLLTYLLCLALLTFEREMKTYQLQR